MKSIFLALSVTLALPSFRMPSLSGASIEKKQPAATERSNPNDPGWPRQVMRDGNRLVYYQPQVDEWKDLREIKARMAFVFTPKERKSAVGVEELSGDTETDLENRTVRITNIKAEAVRFPSYYYSPYFYPGPVPYYRPYYATYGVSAAYHPYNGAYAIGGYAYGPYNAAGRAAWYNPATGAYGRAYTTQYPYGGRTSAWGYNPSTNTSWTTQQGHGYYAQWGSSTITRGGDTYQTGHVVTNYGSSTVAKGPNNLYAGHDGNVYKRDDNGSWSKYDNGQWQPVNAPSSNNPNKLNSQGGQNNLSSTNSASPNSQGKRQGRSSATTRGAESGQSKTIADKEFAGGTENQGGQVASRQSSNELTSGLDRDASARKRGSQNVNLQQNSQKRNSNLQRSTRAKRSESQRRSRREGTRRRD
jgi:hypothetical protein